jgi:hypothetical protein
VTPAPPPIPEALASFAAHFEEPRVLDGLRAVYLGAARVLAVPGFLTPLAAALLRVRARAAGLHPYWVADRGRYSVSDIEDATLIGRLAALAARVAGEELALEDARFLLFETGSYALAKDSGAAAARVVELTLNFSAAEHPAAAMIHALGGTTLAAVQHQPLSLSLIERPTGAVRSERYLPRSAGPAEVWLLRLTLAPATTPAAPATAPAAPARR